jgi:hypothetical protein
MVPSRTDGNRGNSDAGARKIRAEAGGDVIGVISHEEEWDAVREFFELFKTPWEFYQTGHHYSVVITTQDRMPAKGCARAVVIYSARALAADGEIGVTTQPGPKEPWIQWNRDVFPVYGNVAVIQCAGQPLATLRGTALTVSAVIVRAGLYVVRIGFDLFREVQFLLSEGQPPANAQIPTLEFHAALLRAVMLSGGISFVEVPPVPAGYQMITCLTHDVDFRGIRDHKLDRTMWGFVYRALVGSLLRAFKTQAEWPRLWTNVKAVLSLPLVYSGLKQDFWLEFERYAVIEHGLGSTFYFVPFCNYPGTHSRLPAPKQRAVKYDLSAVKEDARHLLDRGFEVGVHGIDAWQDSAKGLLERRRIDQITAQPETGVRMHWLYSDAGTPKALKQAGFAYDSTFGYNDAIGFRAGTSQVFCPCGPESVFELPLTIQDTALFYPDRMNLSEPDALKHCEQVIEAACRFGGVLTINWHTRSLSPERLWGDFYMTLLSSIKKRAVWFAPANTIVKWFRQRRLLQFDGIQFSHNDVSVSLKGAKDPMLPAFLVRIYDPRLQPKNATTGARYPAYVEHTVSGEGPYTISI